MPVKKYTQSGIFSLTVLLPVLLLCIVMLIISGFDEPVTVIILSFVILIFIVCILIFYKLTILIDDTHLTFSMGIGLVRKTFPLSDISGCRPVTNSPFSGVGIHLTSAGWLYNVSGRQAIELSFKSDARKIRIGTDKAEEISRVIGSQVNGSMAGSYYDRGGHAGLYLLLAMIAATVALPVLLLFFGSRDTELTFGEKTVDLSGLYGISIPYSGILNADTMQSLPGIRSRTNGFASGKVLKGHFKLNDQSKVLLFIKKGVPPYIRLRTSETVLYINFDSPRKTRQVFSTIREKSAVH